jgi:O-antigen/teichoic acid export membrane protein
MAAIVTALTTAGAVLLIIGLIVRSIPAIAVGSVSLLLSVLLNLKLYRWLWSHGGAAVGLAAIPLQILYQLISAVAVPVGTFQYLLLDKYSSSKAGGTPSGGAPRERFLPLALGEVGARVIAFTATAYLARHLGASGFGQIAFATALVSHFGIALSAGVGDVGARDVARDPEHAPRLASIGISLRLILAAIAVVAIFAVASLLHIDRETRYVTWLYAFSVIPFALDTNWVYKGQGRTGRVAIALLLAQLIALVMILLLVRSRSDVERVPVIQIGADLIAGAFLLIPLLRGRWIIPSYRELADLARRVRIVTISRILRTIVVSFDIVLLGLMVSTSEVGWYSAAYRIVFFVMAIIMASHVAFVSEAARAPDDPAALSAVLSKAIAMALTVTLPFAIGGSLVAFSLVTTVFGAQYANGAVPLQILLVSLLFLALHGATRNIFLALHRMELELAFVATGVVVNVVANLVLIPRYGIVGAAIATVAGEAAILVGVFGALARMGIKPGIGESLPAIVAGITMGGALLALGVDRPLVQSVIAGGFVYTFAMAAFTLVSKRRAAALAPEA